MLMFMLAVNHWMWYW